MHETLSRKDRERLVRRQAMIDSARSVFAEKGYEAATIEEIAHRAEFGKGTIYNYFDGGKEEILLAVIEDLFDQLSSLADEILSAAEKSGSTFREMLFRFIEAYLHFFNERRDLFFIIMKEVNRMMLSENQESLVFVSRNRDRLAKVLTPYLDRAVSQGILGNYPTHFMAHMILGNAHGYMMMMQQQDRCLNNSIVPTDSRKAASLVTDILINGITARRQ